MLDAPTLPSPRGPLSTRVLHDLRGAPGTSSLAGAADRVASASHDDLHLALYTCYELHYRGFAGVDPAWEWDPALLGLRARLEDRFERELRAAVDVPRSLRPTDVVPALKDMLRHGSGPSLSTYAETEATLEQLRELAVIRSPYQLKEADPHTWAIPRLPAGAAKSALLRLQMDEYGEGAPLQSHAELFADTMRALDLDDGYGAYLDLVPGVVLATVNLLTMFGLHRRFVGACLGHLAVFEMTSVVPMTRYAAATRRVTGGPGAEFYEVHVVADALHERVAEDELLPGLLAADPALAPSVLFGAAALSHLEMLLATHVVDAWSAGTTALRRPLRPVARSLAASAG